jgi:ferredoxin
LEAREIVIGVVDGELGVPSLVHAIGERKMPAPTRVVTVPNRFISGEGGALVRGINGETPIPPGRKVLASDAGVGGLPTLLSNAETFAQLGLAARLGPSEYSSVGTATEPGTVMLTVGGSVAGPAVVETPAGVPLSDILAMCGATLGEGVLVGGFHGSWLSPLAVSQARVSREGLAAVGGALGVGVVLPLGDGTCPLGEVTRVIYYLAGQSSGQCGPCRLGLPDVARAFAALTGGAREAVDEIRSAGNATRGRGACKHPDGTVRFALSALETFTDDLAAHIIYDGCGRPVKGIMPVPNDGAGARLHVDWTRCDGHGLCSYILREVVQLDRNGFPAFSEAPVPAWLEADARKAVRMCPALALRLTPASA